jgi:hypothetical protein
VFGMGTGVPSSLTSPARLHMQAVSSTRLILLQCTSFVNTFTGQFQGFAKVAFYF